MALSLRNTDLEHLARKLSLKSGCNITETICMALEAMDRQVSGEGDKLRSRLADLASSCAALPDLDSRSEDRILGYDALGMPSHDN